MTAVNLIYVFCIVAGAWKNARATFTSSTNFRYRYTCGFVLLYRTEIDSKSRKIFKLSPPGLSTTEFGKFKSFCHMIHDSVLIYRGKKQKLHKQ